MSKDDYVIVSKEELARLRAMEMSLPLLINPYKNVSRHLVIDKKKACEILCDWDTSRRHLEDN